MVDADLASCVEQVLEKIGIDPGEFLLPLFAAGLFTFVQRQRQAMPDVVRIAGGIRGR